MPPAPVAALPGWLSPWEDSVWLYSEAYHLTTPIPILSSWCIAPLKWPLHASLPHQLSWPTPTCSYYKAGTVHPHSLHLINHWYLLILFPSSFQSFPEPQIETTVISGHTVISAQNYCFAFVTGPLALSNSLMLCFLHNSQCSCVHASFPLCRIC